MYGPPVFGDEHVLVRFAPDGTAALSRRNDDGERVWDALSGWVADGGEIAFSDSRTGRRFTANLRRDTLGGGWRTASIVGGWWCASLDDAAYANVTVRQGDAPTAPLVPIRTATPYYPLEAIRKAKQGRAVTCFFVDPAGFVVQPQIVELSDEVFRQPTLTALARSQYHVSEGTALRPGCRTYTYRLDAIRAEAAAE